MSRKMRVTLTVVVIVALVGSSLLGFVWSQQRRLIYFPSPGPLPSATTILPTGKDVVLDTEDGLRLAAWYFPAPSHDSAPAVVIFNGNADYRGYGGNPGRPTEEGLATDARAAQAWLAGQPDVDPSRIAYFGESLGAAVAVELAVRRPPAALVLRSPFTSLADVGVLHYPWLPVRQLLIDRYPSIERIAAVKAPVLVIAGDRDNVVPASLSRRLFDAAAEPKQYVVIPGVGHNDQGLLDGRQMIGDVLKFLEGTPVLGR